MKTTRTSYTASTMKFYVESSTHWHVVTLPLEVEGPEATQEALTASIHRHHGAMEKTVVVLDATNGAPPFLANALLRLPDTGFYVAIKPAPAVGTKEFAALQETASSSFAFAKIRDALLAGTAEELVLE